MCPNKDSPQKYLESSPSGLEVLALINKHKHDNINPNTMAMDDYDNETENNSYTQTLLSSNNAALFSARPIAQQTEQTDNPSSVNPTQHRPAENSGLNKPK